MGSHLLEGLGRPWMECSQIHIRSHEGKCLILHILQKSCKQSMFFKNYWFFSTAYFKYCKTMSSNSSMNYMINVLHVSFPWNTNKTIIFPLNTILVLKLSSFGDATSHPLTIWSGNRSNGNVSKILPVLFQWVPTTITPPVHRFADAYNFNNVVYQPSEYRDQENTCCHNYHWLTQKMLPKWQERIKKSTPIALNSNSKSLCDFQPIWVNP